jgi:uncharacterized membrane protein HdeD (DUF308 family)
MIQQFAGRGWDVSAVAEKVHRGSVWMEVLGVLLIVFGMASLIFVGAASLASVFFIGFLLLASGVAQFATAFGYWRVRWGGFFAGLALGLLYAVAGVLCFVRPLSTLVGLTYILGIFYFVMGIFRILFHVVTRFPSWGWGVVTGFINIGLGFLILSAWPASSFMVLGILVGIDLLFAGMQAVSTGSVVRRMTGQAAPAAGQRPITRFQH